MRKYAALSQLFGINTVGETKPGVWQFTASTNPDSGISTDAANREALRHHVTGHVRGAVSVEQVPISAKRGAWRQRGNKPTLYALRAATLDDIGAIASVTDLTAGFIEIEAQMHPLVPGLIDPDQRAHVIDMLGGQPGLIEVHKQFKSGFLILKAFQKKE